MTIETNGGWIEEIPAVDIELMANGNVCVTDKSDFQQNYSVVLHPVHLRLIAEKLGLVGTLSDSEVRALRMVDKLARRMAVLHERIKQVHAWVWSSTDFDDRDINIEAWHLDATLDLSTEFQTEIEESRTVVTPRHGGASRNERDGIVTSDGVPWDNLGTSALVTEHGNTPQKRGASAVQMELAQ